MAMARSVLVKKSSKIRRAKDYFGLIVCGFRCDFSNACKQWRIADQLEISMN
jgi:hypothetical protein